MPLDLAALTAAMEGPPVITSSSPGNVDVPQRAASAPPTSPVCAGNKRTYDAMQNEDSGANFNYGTPSPDFLNPSSDPSLGGMSGSSDWASLSRGDDDFFSNTSGSLSHYRLPMPVDKYEGSNLELYTNTECKRAKLDAAEITAVHAFNVLSWDKKLAKLLILSISSKKKLAILESGKTAHWPGPSEQLKANIKKYAHAVLVSPTLHGYRERVAANNLIAIVKRLRFDLPDKIEENRAQWALVESEVSDALTQRRRVIKDEIKNSKNLHIYELTEKILQKSDVPMTLDFVARVAIMRAVYFKEEKTDGKYWQEVDKMLSTIRQKSKDDPVARSHGLRWFIEQDTNTYGTGGATFKPNYTTNIPAWVQEVNNVISGNAGQRD